MCSGSEEYVSTVCPSIDNISFKWIDVLSPSVTFQSPPMLQETNLLLLTAWKLAWGWESSSANCSDFVTVSDLSQLYTIWSQMKWWSHIFRKKAKKMHMRDEIEHTQWQGCQTWGKDKLARRRERGRTCANFRIITYLVLRTAWDPEPGDRYRPVWSIREMFSPWISATKRQSWHMLVKYHCFDCCWEIIPGTVL